MIREWNGLPLTPIIDASTPPLKHRPGDYKAKEAGRPARTPMFWAYWDGKHWGPVVKSKDRARAAYDHEVATIGTTMNRRCCYQGVAK